MSEPIVIRRTFYPVKQFVSWYAQSQIDLRPPFQRKNAWNPQARSYLMDTVIRGLPIPIVILRDKPGVTFEPRTEVVDGQQRLTTLLAFVKPDSFPVEAFTISRAHSKELAGKSFAQLSSEIQQRILDYEISVHILPSSVDDQQVLSIFSRLNATGVKLNAQELRNAKYQGVFKQFVFGLSLEHFGHWQSFGIFADEDFARMKEVEYASILILRILKGVTGTSQVALDNLYRQFDDEFPDEDEIRRRFDAVFEEIDTGFGTSIARTPLRRTTWFHALFSEVHDRLYGTERNVDPPYLSHSRMGRLPDTFWQNVGAFARYLVSDTLPAEVVKDLMGQTTNQKSRLKRVELMRQHVR